MNTKKNIYIIVVILLSFTRLTAQVTSSDVKVAYIYRFTNYIEWTNQDEKDQFTIGVFEDDEIMLTKFKYLSKTRKINRKKIKIVSIKNLKQLENENLDVLSVNYKRNSNILNIFSKIKGKNTLLITDNCPFKEAVMINFLPSVNKEIVSFEINKKNSSDENLIIKPDILLLGGTYIDVRKLFKEKEDEIEFQKEKLKKSKIEVEKQKNIILKQDKEIANREEIIIIKSNKIQQQELKLYSQKKGLDSLSLEISQKMILLNKNSLKLKNQDRSIINSQKDLKKTNSELSKQNKKLNKQKELIKKQENVLLKRLSKIELQQNILYASLFIIILILFLVYFIYKSFKIKKRANIKLKAYNDEILSQNEEIKSQREEIGTARDNLEVANIELEKLSLVASKTNNAVVITDSNAEIEWVNEGFTKLFGYQYDELVHKFGKNLASSSSYSKIKEKIKECKKTKKTVEYFVQNTTKSGKKLWMHTSLTPIVDAVGNVVKLIAIEANITELKKAEENIKIQKIEIEQHIDEIETQRDKVEEQNKELENYRNHLEKIVDLRTKQLIIAKEKAEESDRLKSSFIENMSHEIRTPMNAILGFSNLLILPDTSKEKAKSFIEIIETNANSLANLIDDIIDLSKIEAGKLTIKKSDCDINHLLDNLLITYKESNKKKYPNIQLKLSKQVKDTTFIINTDKNRVKQVLINLLNNAIKFTEKGNIDFGYKIIKTNDNIKPNNNVKINTNIEKQSQQSILFFIKDNGIGIEKTSQKMIFERFSKIERNKKKLYRGTGLGLSISKSIVNKLGGQIWLESEINKGSTFYFTIPY